MVVTPILTAALSPVTGALFGLAYGTSIRIGYEIIFPALFNKNEKPGSKDVVKALSDMYAISGGLEAHKFGIQQGIEMAKKKTESQDVQTLIALENGLTSEQQSAIQESFDSNKSTSLLGGPNKLFIDEDTTQLGAPRQQQHKAIKVIVEEQFKGLSTVTSVEIRKLAGILADNETPTAIAQAFKSIRDNETEEQVLRLQINYLDRNMPVHHRAALKKAILYAWLKLVKPHLAARKAQALKAKFKSQQRGGQLGSVNLRAAFTNKGVNKDILIQQREIFSVQLDVQKDILRRLKTIAPSTNRAIEIKKVMNIILDLQKKLANIKIQLSNL